MLPPKSIWSESSTPRRGHNSATRALTRMGERLGPSALELRRVFRRNEPEVLLEALAGCAELGRAVRVLTPDMVELMESRSTEVADRDISIDDDLRQVRRRKVES